MILADVLEHISAMRVAEILGAGSKDRPGGTKKRTAN